MTACRQFKQAAGISFAFCASWPDNPAMESPEVLIVGAGVIGCSLARALARLSKQVTVVDCGRAGAAASSAAAGLLLPTFSGAVDGPLAELAFQSAAGYA